MNDATQTPLAAFQRIRSMMVHNTIELEGLCNRAHATNVTYRPPVARIRKKVEELAQLLFDMGLPPDERSDLRDFFDSVTERRGPRRNALVVDPAVLAAVHAAAHAEPVEAAPEELGG